MCNFVLTKTQRLSKPLRSDAPPPIKLSTVETLQHIKNVIAETDVPTWVESVPANFGDAAAGTLKADEWRTLGTIYLPLALISLWGHGSRHTSDDYEASRLRAYLDHTMLIVSAVVIACKRTASERRSRDFLQCITEYLTDLQTLHPNANYRPYHHLAMHLPRFFRLFGPARCFWTYPFERVIGQIQRILSNHRLGMFSMSHLASFAHDSIGQMESTLLHSFLKSSKIKRWLSDPDQPAAIREIKTLFDNIYAPNSNEDGPSDGFDEHERLLNKLSGNAIPSSLRPLLTLPLAKSEVSLRARFKRQGVVFATNHTHRGNSQIYFYPDGNTKLTPVPGFIEYIYTERAKPDTVSFAVQTAIPVGDDIYDPFSKYEHWPARLYSRSQSSCVRVHPEWLYCQFACWNRDHETMVILSLNRVCLSAHCLCDIRLTYFSA